MIWYIYNGVVHSEPPPSGTDYETRNSRNAGMELLRDNVRRRKNRRMAVQSGIVAVCLSIVFALMWVST